MCLLGAVENHFLWKPQQKSLYLHQWVEMGENIVLVVRGANSKKCKVMYRKQLFLMVVAVASLVLPSCVKSPAILDVIPMTGAGKRVSLESLTSRSGVEQEDSLVVMSRLQSDVDYLMMSRVLQKDGLFVLAIKREDALFLGVSEAVYDHYVEYVYRLNNPTPVSE